MPLSSIYAQNRLKFSTTEDVAIAFYKTGGTVPNFERWIKEREPYNLTPWAKREEMLKGEMTRLQKAYQDFDAEEDFLLIRTFVRVTPQEHVSPEGEKTYTLPIVFSQAPDALYFPYDFLGERIIVLPYNLDTVMNAPIEEYQYGFIKEATRNSDENTMIVRLQAKEGDLSKPYKIDGLDQWVLKADIVSMEIWNQQKRLIWEYTAPWYVSPNRIKLDKLYEGRPTESPEKGSVKPLTLGTPEQ